MCAARTPADKNWTLSISWTEEERQGYRGSTPTAKKGCAMETLPREIVRVLRVFEDVFSERVWDWVQVLVVGAILAPGRRTVAAVLRVMGLGDGRQFQNYHRVLNRASWSSLEAGRRLLGLLVEAFVPA